MDSGKNIVTLRVATERVAKLVVKCKACTTCCENGLVYVFDEEVEIMKNMNVPLMNIMGVHYIQRIRGGGCPMMNVRNRCCTIYTERPICCRLYPLDVFNRSGKLEWGLYTYCPVEKQKAGLLVTTDEKLNYGLVLQALHMIEGILGDRRIHFLAYEDIVSAEHELLDQFRNEYVILGDVLMQFPGIMNGAVISNTPEISFVEVAYA